jgi:hypothetical protein
MATPADLILPLAYISRIYILSIEITCIYRRQEKFENPIPFPAKQEHKKLFAIAL